MKHVQSVTIVLKSGRQVVINTVPPKVGGSAHSAETGAGTCTSLPASVLNSLVMDVRAMDLNLDYIHKLAKR